MGAVCDRTSPAHEESAPLITQLSESAIFDALRHVQEPELGRDIVTLNMVKAVAIDGTNVAITIELTTPACPLKDEIERNMQTAVRALGAEVRALHCEPDGHNINRKAGALHVERLQQEVLDFKAYLGIAFDGDADRAMFVDSRGVRRDGDDVLYLLGRFSDFQGGPRVVVGTVMANLGLEVALESLGIRLVRTSVGDRYVLEEMLRLGLVGDKAGQQRIAAGRMLTIAVRRKCPGGRRVNRETRFA